MKRKLARRRFLASAAGVSTAAMFFPGVSARTYAANEKLNLALIGCGSRGGNLLDSFRRHRREHRCHVRHEHCVPRRQDVPEGSGRAQARRLPEDARGKQPQNRRRPRGPRDHHHAPCSALAMKLGQAGVLREAADADRA